MGTNSNMINIMKKMLLEGKLMDIFSTITPNGLIILKLKDGKILKYQVISNMTGRIIMKDEVSDIQYVMTKDSLNNGELIINRYDGNEQDFKNKDDIKLDVDKFLVTDKQGNSKSIDIEPQEPESEESDVDPHDESNLLEFNDSIMDIKVGDSLIITYDGEIPLKKGDNKKDSIVNDLFFKVMDVSKKSVDVRLVDIKGNVDGEESRTTEKLINKLGDRTITIKRYDPFKLKDNQIYINFNYKGIGAKTKYKGFKLYNVLGVEVNNINIDDSDDGDNDGETKKYSEDDFYSWVNDKRHPERLNFFNKQPNMLRTIAGASPTGLYQLKNLMQKATLDKSYLTKGKRVKFKLGKGQMIRGERGFYLTSNRGKTYEGVMVAPKKIKIGVIGRRNFYLHIKEELENDSMTFKVDVEFCGSDNSCEYVKKGATIKIINNE